MGSKERFTSLLREFVLDIADPKSVEKINRDLSDASFNFSQTKTYYQNKKSELFEYTLKNEIDRMTYIIRYRNRMIENKDEIRKIARTSSDLFIFHYANQSLFADILTSIQTNLLLPHSSLSLSVTNDTTVFELTEPHQLRASSNFLIRTLDNVVFGTIRGNVHVDVEEMRMHCEVKPFQMNMLFDEKIEKVAAMLAIASTKCINKAPSTSQNSSVVDKIFAHPPPDMVKLLDNGFKMFDSFIRSATTSAESEAGETLASLVRENVAPTPPPSHASEQHVDDQNCCDDSWGDWGDDADWGDDDDGGGGGDK